MTYKEWKARYCLVGKVIDWDNVSGVQCLDLPKSMFQLVYGIPTTKGKAAFGNACDYWRIDEKDWEGYTAGFNKYFFKIKNTPSFVPRDGDVAIWGKGYQSKTSKYKGCGHIAICNGIGDTKQFRVFEENAGGKHDPVSYDWQTYERDFKGVLRPFYIVKAPVNVRKEPIVSKDTFLYELKKGERVPVYDIKDGWANIGKGKYCAASYLELP